MEGMHFASESVVCLFGFKQPSRTRICIGLPYRMAKPATTGSHSLQESLWRQTGSVETNGLGFGPERASSCELAHFGQPKGFVYFRIPGASVRDQQGVSRAVGIIKVVDGPVTGWDSAWDQCFKIAVGLVVPAGNDPIGVEVFLHELDQLLVGVGVNMGYGNQRVPLDGEWYRQ